MYPLSKDRLAAPWRWIEMVEIYTLAGYVDEAIEQIDALLSIECYVNTNWMKQNPLLASVRKDPRFDELMRKYY